MSRNAEAHIQAGIGVVVGLAWQSAAALTDRLTEAPTRVNFAIEALEAIADEAEDLIKKCLDLSAT